MSGEDGMKDGALQGVAIIGMAGRFPGAPDVSTFWRNIKDGVESITQFPREELEIDDPVADDEDAGQYVCAKGMLDDVEMFDARFFGYLPREAEVMDPQHRIFLEICWEAMEHAGYDSRRYPGSVGVYGGCYMDTYVLWNLCADEDFRRKLVASIQVGSLQTELGNDKDYLATRVAYKMGLRGPAMTLQTACSTSLVAIATACQSIESYQCDMALAGGVTLILPQKKGYFYKEGGMLSPDGHCRTFDEKAAGTVFSHGAAVVLLKRLEDAIADGDTIYGVIRGYATNNDGGDKVSYTAPSVEGQAEVISLALGMAGIDARTIGYVEAHGTATPLGDPIEVAGLTTAYRTMTDDRQYCAIGSVKANLGHLDVASGAIGLIKTTLSLKEKILPPMINFERPNPNIDFEATPFYVNVDLKDWPAQSWPRRAGVSSFGVGGTNAHVVVEEPPAMRADESARAVELLVLSARTKTALDAMAERLAAHLSVDDGASLADIAHTLRVGRTEFEHRRIVVARDRAGAAGKLASAAAPHDKGVVAASQPEIVFMYPGQGAQYPGMGRELYEAEPVYRAAIDEIAEALTASEYEGDIRRFLLCPEDTTEHEALAKELAETCNAQPAIFAVEVAMTRLFESWGVRPDCVLGHSIGEFAAAVAAGVFDVADAAQLVAARGRLMQAQPAGRMLAVMAPRPDVEPMLPDGVAIAAVNAPGACVASGESDKIAVLEKALEAAGVGFSPLHTSHAFHSPMMAPVHDALIERARNVAACTALLPVFSTATGGRAADDLFADPQYWGLQLMQPVLFAEALAAAAGDGLKIFVEVGPGQTLAALARQTLETAAAITSTLGPPRAPGSDLEHALGALGRIWLGGRAPDWPAFTVGRRRRTPLPTYPFERKRHWVDPTPRAAAAAGASANGAANESDIESLIRQQLTVVAHQLELMRRS